MRKGFLALIFGGLAAGSAWAQNDWPYFAADLGGSQYSPLAQIDKSNVSRLERVWVHESGDVVRVDGWGATSLQVTPIHANGLLYYCTPLNRVFALDPATGTERWVFDPHDDSKGTAVVEGDRAGGTCRGVAYWSAEEPDPNLPCEQRIFKSDSAGRIFAIDARSGESCSDFGAAAGHPGYAYHGDYENFGEGRLGMSSPGLVVGNVLVTGVGADDGNQDSNDGVVRGWDVITGERIWEFNPIPEDRRDQTGAANVWINMSGDVDNDLVFAPTTSPSTDYYGGNRLFDIPLADAVVAIKASTGEQMWSFQTVVHDLFDYDLPAHAVLATIRKDGQRRDVAIQQTKMGHIFVFDRMTGESLFPIEYRDVPASDIEGERSAPQQPFAVLPEAFARQTMSRDELFGLTPLDRGSCRKIFDEVRYEGMYTPPSAQGSILFPSALGGGNWGGAAYDPNSNQLIIKSENLATVLRLVKHNEGDELPPPDYLTRPLKGTPYRTEGELFMSSWGIPCTPPPWGTLSAIDMDSGKLNWQIPVGQIKQWGVTVPASFGWGSPHIGGVIVTASGLVFTAGTMDEKIRAFDVETGEELWQAKLPTWATAMPMTYEADGRQFLVIAAGGTSRVTKKLDDDVIAFALPVN